jgi:hypothetical protein
LKTFNGPIFEVPISNIHARDEIHRHSKLSSAVKGAIAGLGPYGYRVAMQAALHAFQKLPESCVRFSAAAHSPYCCKGVGEGVGALNRATRNC